MTSKELKQKHALENEHLEKYRPYPGCTNNEIHYLYAKMWNELREKQHKEKKKRKKDLDFEKECKKRNLVLVSDIKELKKVKNNSLIKKDQVGLDTKKEVQALCKSIRESGRYATWRWQVFQKNNGAVCARCGNTKSVSKIVVHHKYPFEYILFQNQIKTLAQALECAELWSVRNGEVLCEECHQKEHPWLA
jgi:hypothetical protein